MKNNRISELFSVTRQELVDLFQPGPQPEGMTKAILLLTGILFSPIAMFGALIGYKRGHERFMEDEYPRLYNLQPIMRVAMILGAVLVLGGVILLAKLVIWIFTPGGEYEDPTNTLYALAFIGINGFLTIFVGAWFRKWRGGIHKFFREAARYGTARFAKEQELQPYQTEKGFYIGGGLYYNKPGHLTSTAGTRAGKGVNLILQNLLMPHLAPSMSWVVIDPKGELAAISANAQRAAGRKVIILNPWKILLMQGAAYNPLDLLKNDYLNLADDVQMLAEAIVPADGKKEDHWNTKARVFISGLLLHLVTTAPKEDRHLGTLWRWLRLDPQSWISLLAAMSMNEDENAGEIVQATANEIISLMKNSDKEFGSVMSSAQKWTDFIKSPALREAMKTSTEFTSDDLASGNCTVYLCIPFERLTSHNAWLRLVVTSLMRSVIRNPKKDVCFLIDEAYTFGYHSEIDIALGAYAGFGVHVWSIFQSLVQIKNTYHDNWENFIANSSVRHFFNISDNFSSEYVSKMFGQMSVPHYNGKGEVTGATGRPLVTMDEVRTTSGNTIYTVIDQLPPAEILKLPYYMMDLPADPNPYFKE